MNNRITLLRMLALAALCTLFYSFTVLPGAHRFQVYLDSKLMVEQYVNPRAEAPRLVIDPSVTHQQLVINYDECGRTVSNRTLTLKDNNNTVLKKWNFTGDTSGYQDPMTCSWKEIVSLKPKGSNTVKLYYSSKEYPEGVQVAYLVLEKEAIIGKR